MGGEEGEGDEAGGGGRKGRGGARGEKTYDFKRHFPVFPDIFHSKREREREIFKKKPF